MKSLAIHLFEYEKIQTGLQKAKSLKAFVEKLITVGKAGSLHARRELIQYLGNEKIVSKILKSICPRYQNRNGGYTRIIKLGSRAGDGAQIVIIELC